MDGFSRVFVRFFTHARLNLCWSNFLSKELHEVFKFTEERRFDTRFDLRIFILFDLFLAWSL